MKIRQALEISEEVRRLRIEDPMLSVEDALTKAKAMYLGKEKVHNQTCK